MKRSNRREFIRISSYLGLGIACCGCRTSEITGRRQLMLMPEGQEIALGAMRFTIRFPASDFLRIPDYPKS